MQIIEQRLPGRTAAEERSLRDVVRVVENAERRRSTELAKPAPQNDRGMAGRMDRMTAQQDALDNAMAALTAKLDQLAAERLELLPADATDIRHGTGGGGDHSDDRHPVVCTSAGETVSLGACSRIGPAEERIQWFRAAAERRRNQ